MTKKMSMRMAAGFFGCLFLILLDQMTKLAAVTFIRERDFILIPGVFRLTYVENFGAAFGSLQNRTVFLLGVTGVLLVYLVLLYGKLCRTGQYRLLRILILFLAAGGIGNMIDRLLYGYVIDFFYFELISFPVFNLADCFITVSVFVLVISFFTIYKEDDLAVFSLFGKNKDGQE